MSLNIKFYRNLSIVLLCINLALLAFFFLMPPPHHHPRTPNGNHAKKHMSLTEQQQDKFMLLATQHQKQMIHYNQQQHSLIEQYFSPLINPNIVIHSDSLLTAIKRLEEQKVTITYQHFEDIKNILQENQYTLFEDFVQKSINIILQRREKKKH